MSFMFWIRSEFLLGVRGRALGLITLYHKTDVQSEELLVEARLVVEGRLPWLRARRSI